MNVDIKDVRRQFGRQREPLLLNDSVICTLQKSGTALRQISLSDNTSLCNITALSPLALLYFSHYKARTQRALNVCIRATLVGRYAAHFSIISILLRVSRWNTLMLRTLPRSLLLQPRLCNAGIYI